jgi:hypothetical protein
LYQQVNNSVSIKNNHITKNDQNFEGGEDEDEEEEKNENPPKDGSPTGKDKVKVMSYMSEITSLIGVHYV